MRGFHFFRASFPVLALGLLAVVGCGSKGTTVSGTVTFNGKPVEDGYINFYPTDGKSAPAGGEVKGGQYTARNVTPGKNRVEVTAYTRGSGTESMDEAIKAAKKGPTITADTLTDKSEGNNQTHEIPSGGTELNLTLKAAVSSDGKVR